MLAAAPSLPSVVPSESSQQGGYLTALSSKPAAAYVPVFHETYQIVDKGDYMSQLSSGKAAPVSTPSRAAPASTPAAGGRRGLWLVYLDGSS